MRTHLTVLSGAAVLALAACSSTPKSLPQVKHAAVALGSCSMSVSTDTSVQPVITKPSTTACNAAPPRTITATVVHGTGPAATSGDSLSVKYVGYSWANEEVFDTNWTSGGQPFTVSPLGSAQVITAWNLGLQGVHAGDRVVLAVPSADGYGTDGSAPKIAPNENLLFVVDILSVTPASATPSATPSG